MSNAPETGTKRFSPQYPQDPLLTQEHAQKGGVHAVQKSMVAPLLSDISVIPTSVMGRGQAGRGWKWGRGLFVYGKLSEKKIKIHRHFVETENGL